MVWQGTAPAPSCTRLGEAGAAVTRLQDWLLHLRLQALIPLSLEGTEVGQTKAAQALAKITITSNPEMAFPGERVSVAAVGWGDGSANPAWAARPAQGLAREQQWAQARPAVRARAAAARRESALGRRWAEEHEEGLPRQELPGSLPAAAGMGGLRLLLAHRERARQPWLGLKATGLVIRGRICAAGTASMSLPFPGAWEVGRPLVFPTKARWPRPDHGSSSAFRLGSGLPAPPAPRGAESAPLAQGLSPALLSP